MQPKPSQTQPYYTTQPTQTQLHPTQTNANQTKPNTTKTQHIITQPSPAQNKAQPNPTQPSPPHLHPLSCAHFNPLQPNKNIQCLSPTDPLSSLSRTFHSRCTCMSLCFGMTNFITALHRSHVSTNLLSTVTFRMSHALASFLLFRNTEVWTSFCAAKIWYYYLSHGVVERSSTLDSSSGISDQ